VICLAILAEDLAVGYVSRIINNARSDDETLQIRNQNRNMKIYMSEGPACSRRHFLRNTAIGVAAAPFGKAAFAAERKAPGVAGTVHAANTDFASLKQVDAGLLNIGYAEDGPSNWPVVLLLHGWPYDIHSFVDVAPLLASAGYRVIVPHLRGYGTTRFLSSETMRNGQQSAVAVDIIAFIDALRIEKATIAGFDWGARTANIMAALWPERCKAIVSVSG